MKEACVDLILSTKTPTDSTITLVYIFSTVLFMIPVSMAFVVLVFLCLILIDSNQVYEAFNGSLFVLLIFTLMGSYYTWKSTGIRNSLPSCVLKCSLFFRVLTIRK